MAALSLNIAFSPNIPKFNSATTTGNRTSFTPPFLANRQCYRLLQTRQKHIVCSAISGSPGIESSGLVNEDLLDTVKVLDLGGNEIPISDLWKDRKAVVAFARHFGCVLCRKRADYLAAKKDIMDASGVALVLIGPGSVDQAKTFSEQTKFKGEVYADTSHSSYEAFQFVSGVSTTFTPKAGLKIIELYMEGYRQDWKLSFEKDTVARGGWRQGGIIVAGPGKTNISYIHKGSKPIRRPQQINLVNA
ncbi:thioredoxin-like protein AAED1, chloroplastic isoform X2 [Ricinus communis]|uniref:thioredoxin-like protein AAED1, chloroplastic isoform X2 n=1 Tax=Ricinus communis TaxID=3988 RepID=UPI0007722D7B|nr:thioredoxin-like protein AAED1, chloroplastic isoform X2 [Ricinus communis]|eukprot:XP_015578487.1 thioredoxin-like protein AAED1, chloroplastic isoform X2 [Ricinus communis]